VAIVGEQRAGGGRIVLVESEARDALHDGIRVAVEHLAQGDAADVAPRLDAGREESHVVGESGRSLPLQVTLAIEGLQVTHRSARIAVEGAHDGSVDTRLEHGLGARGLAQEIVGPAGDRGECERERGEEREAHHR